jgi:ribonuclease HI
MVAAPHYLLFSEASCSAEHRTWRFVLQNVESRRRMVISDEEEVMCGERLELLAVVRGLEALDGPARVTLVTKSRYVSRGLRFGMTEWRANEWQWERFGRIVPVKDHDLWQRVDRALLFHQVECQAWQFEADAATEEPLSCQVASEAINEVIAPTCNDVPQACKTVATNALTEPCGAILERRAAKISRVRKRRLDPHHAGLKAGLAKTLASRAESLRETLHSLVGSSQNLATGAA